MFVNKSPVIHVNGNVISHGDGTYSAVLANKVVSGFATEADAKKILSFMPYHRGK